MSVQFPVLPIAGSTILRGLASLLALVAHWLKRLAQAHRNRRDARVLAYMDRHMLADIGLTRSDVQDAFSEPFWEDPTALLRERAIERRMNRVLAAPKLAPQEPATEENGFSRPATDRPARLAF
ncbi:MAG: DUF1127 domain-containing protein [Pseudolabrys sp.]|nr:DUF1127 domain-containing protein [Pseudolabrys sp.]